MNQRESPKALCKDKENELEEAKENSLDHVFEVPKEHSDQGGLLFRPDHYAEIYHAAPPMARQERV